MLALLMTVAASCSGGKQRPTPSSTPSESTVPRGGTLRLVVPSFPASAFSQGSGLDPQKAYFSDAWELLRCCLLRTLFSYKGAPTARGGAILLPDLAASMPTVSGDGLIWTFRLKPGLHYAPPLQQVEIKAQDIIRALEREANATASAGGYSFYYFSMISDPKTHVALALFAGWGKDYLNASTYFVPLFTGGSIGANSNYSLLGATPDQLQQWGYHVSNVPGVDDRINACLVLLGEAQLRCWADLDQYLMEDVVPWVPTLSDAHVQVIPSRVVRYTYDQFGDLPALDQVALRPGS